MIFSKVPMQLQVQIENLVYDKQFQQRFATDKILDQLDQLKYNPFIQYNQFFLHYHYNTKINGIELKPITLGLWCFLYIIKSPLIFTDKKWTMIDIDVFFYLLQTKDFNNSLNELIEKSMNYCEREFKLDEKQVEQLLQKLIKVSFRVLNMFPKYSLEENKPVFNVDWLTSIATKVVQVSSYTTQQIYNQISICQAFYLFAQYCREKGSESIFLRTDEEIMQEQDLRATTLLVERLIELNKIDQKDKQFYINLIHNQEND